MRRGLRMVWLVVMLWIAKGVAWFAWQRDDTAGWSEGGLEKEQSARAVRAHEEATTLLVEISKEGLDSPRRRAPDDAVLRPIELLLKARVPARYRAARGPPRAVRESLGGRTKTLKTLNGEEKRC